MKHKGKAPRNWRKRAAALAAGALAFVGLGAVTEGASAHSATPQTSATCTSTGWDATFSATNDYGQTSVMSGTGTALDGNYAKAGTIVKGVHTDTKSVTYHMSFNDSSKSFPGGKGTMRWSDGYTESNITWSAVTKPKGCAPGKVYVCKYVGTPGVDERLQTGQNPIEVSTNSIQNNRWNGQVPGWFSDAHDRSYVLGYVPMTPEPTAKSCPTPTKPDKPAPVTKPLHDSRSTCDLGNQERTGTETTDWTFDENTWSWVPGTPVDSWNDWTTVSDLTPAQKAELNCTTPPPPPPTPTTVKPTAPTVTMPTCANPTETVSWTTPSQEGVIRTPNGSTPLAPGKSVLYTVKPGSNTVFPADAQTSWPFSNTFDVKSCVTPPPPHVVKPTASVKANCSCNGTVKLNTPGTTYRVSFVQKVHGHYKHMTRSVYVPNGSKPVVLHLSHLRHYSHIKVSAKGMKSITKTVPGPCVKHAPHTGLRLVVAPTLAFMRAV